MRGRLRGLGRVGLRGIESGMRALRRPPSTALWAPSPRRGEGPRARNCLFRRGRSAVSHCPARTGKAKRLPGVDGAGTLLSRVALVWEIALGCRREFLVMLDLIMRTICVVFGLHFLYDKHEESANRIAKLLSDWGQVAGRKRSQEAGFDRHPVKQVELPMLQRLRSGAQSVTYNLGPKGRAGGNA